MKKRTFVRRRRTAEFVRQKIRNRLVYSKRKQIAFKVVFHTS